MNEQDICNFIKDRYEDQRDWYEKKASEKKKLHDITRVIIIIIAPLVPFSILIDDPTVKIFSIMTSMIVVICTSLINTFKFQEDWLNYRTTAEMMKKEYFLYYTGVGDYRDNDDKDGLFIRRIESMISQEHTKWFKYKNKKEM